MKKLKLCLYLFFLIVLITNLIFLFLHEVKFVIDIDLSSIDLFLVFGILTSLVFLFILHKPVFKQRSRIREIYISLFVGILIFFLLKYFHPINDLENSFTSWKLQFFIEETVKKETISSLNELNFVEFKRPKEARDDIQIIGITNETLERSNGEWPLDWKYYAKLIELFKGTNNILMFDIFFLDNKKEQIELLEKELIGSNHVLFDYPLETDLEQKKSIVDFENRLNILKQYSLCNVKDPKGRASTLANYPVPPVSEISKHSAGLGFANIYKDRTGVNRKMPLFAKIISEDKKSINFYPSIELTLAANFYGIDLKNDIDIEVGKFVRFKNIPRKFIDQVNLKTLETEKKDIMNIPNDRREIFIPVDNSGQMNINFIGSRFSFQVHDLMDVVNDWDKDTVHQFNNTIFLVGIYYATGRGASKDTHLSPFGEMAGIEHHAFALNTILNQTFVTELSHWQKLLIIFFLALLIGLIQPVLKTWFSFIFIPLLISFYTVLNLYAYGKYLTIIPYPSIVFFQIFGTFVLLIGYRIINEEKNVKYIKNTFSKFVSKDVVEELLKHPEKLELGGTKKEVTIFFSDIRGFTSLSEKLSPEDLVNFLNEYLSLMSNAIISFKGTIDKYMGDAIMAFWGAPLPLEEHAYYACLASIIQMELLNELKMRWESKKIPVFDIGIGLNTGLAVVGNVGSSQRMDYTCMGDSINLGSRLESANKFYGTNIIISENTYEKVANKVIVRELDLVRVKGKSKPIRIFELIGIKDRSDLEKYKKVLKMNNQ